MSLASRFTHVLEARPNLRGGRPPESFCRRFSTLSPTLPSFDARPLHFTSLAAPLSGTILTIPDRYCGSVVGESHNERRKFGSSECPYPAGTPIFATRGLYAPTPFGGWKFSLYVLTAFIYIVRLTLGKLVCANDSIGRPWDSSSASSSGLSGRPRPRGVLRTGWLYHLYMGALICPTVRIGRDWPPRSVVLASSPVLTWRSRRTLSSF